ncbi:MAG: flagellar biosynthesis anti-sigma factor FlgM [Burkholderiales bacterium]
MVDISIKSVAGAAKAERQSRTSQKSGSEGARSVASTPSDSVHLTPLSGELSKLSGDVPVFDTAKVDAIKQAIREGKFTVNAEAVADRLLSDVRALVSKKD